MTERERILVTDGQTQQALACTRSLGRAGHEVVVASTRRKPLAAWSRYCRARFRLAGETVAAFASLREWAAAHGVTLVVPGTERACLLIDAERERWEAAGITPGCAPEPMLRQAFDKVATLEIAARCGVRTPPWRNPQSLEEARAAAREFGYPLVLKSRFSNLLAGDRFIPDPGTTYVRDPAALDRAVLSRRQGPWWPILQGFVPGRGAGVFVLASHGRPLAWFAHERLRDVRPSGSGSSLRRSIALDPRLRAPAERLLAAMAWDGPAMIELRDDGGEPYLMEVNGRFWGSLQLAISAGVDFPRLWVAALRGDSLEPTDRYQVGVTVRWLWGDVKRFLYILKGPPAGYPGRYPTVWQGLREMLGRQPAGTRLEAWAADDRGPALGEWIQGIADLVAERRRHGAPPLVGATPADDAGRATHAGAVVRLER
jgi:predicted ATP-grasp superfamily ATP-dependent carboligase